MQIGGIFLLVVVAAVPPTYDDPATGAARDARAQPARVAWLGKPGVDAGVVATYRRFLASLDPSDPRTTLIASGFLTDRLRGATDLTRDVLVGEFLAYFERARRAQTGILAAIADRRAANQRAVELHWQLQPYGLTVESCEEQSHAAVEVPGFILRRLRTFATPAAARFLHLREAEVQEPLGAGCEGLPQADISAEQYVARKRALVKFVERHPEFALKGTAQDYLARYATSYRRYARQFRH